MAESKEVICQLKREQDTTWSIVLDSLSPQSLLTILTDINECQVRELYIFDTHFDNNCVNQLLQALTDNQTMRSLYLISSPLVPDTYHLLTTAVADNKIIKELGLWHDDYITNNDIPHLSHLITNNKTLQVLYLYGCPKITEFGIQQLQSVSDKNNSLESLFINDYYLLNQY